MVERQQPQWNFDEAVMTDIATLELELVRIIDAAADEAELEAVRVAALASGARSRLCWRRSAKMSPDERKQQGRSSTALRTGLPRRLRHGGRFSGRRA